MGSECPIPGELIIEDVLSVASKSGKRCSVIQIPGTPPTVLIALPIRDKLIIDVLLAKGRETSPEEQAILETILDTLTISP